MSDTLEEIILANFQGSFSKRESRMIASTFGRNFFFSSLVLWHTKQLILTIKFLAIAIRWTLPFPCLKFQIVAYAFYLGNYVFSYKTRWKNNLLSSSTLSTRNPNHRLRVFFGVRVRVRLRIDPRVGLRVEDRVGHALKNIKIQITNTNKKIKKKWRRRQSLFFFYI